MTYRYSHQKLKQELQNMTTMEHVPHVVQAVGIPYEEAAALVNFILKPCRPQPSDTKQESNNLAGALQRCNAMIQKARQDKLNGLVYENPLIRKYTPFEQDVIHIRHLLGRESHHDGASRNNPEFNTTSLVQDIDLSYGQGRARSILLLCGSKGCGKTHADISKALQIAKVEFDFLGKLTSTNAVFLTAKDLTDMLRDKHYRDLKNVKECGVLIIDDLGTEPIGYKGADFNAEFQGIMDYRHKFRRQTILTTNLEPVSDNPEEQTFSTQYGARVLSRLRQEGVVISSNIDDMRGRQ